MKKENDYFLEAEKIGAYLLSIPIKNSEKSTYAQAINQLNINFTAFEEVLWQKMLQSNWKMACIDAGLALLQPTSNVRRKIFTMLAILETSPNYTDYFFSKKFSFFYMFKIGLVSFRAIIRAIFGVVLIKIIQKKCS